MKYIFSSFCLLLSSAFLMGQAATSITLLGTGSQLSVTKNVGTIVDSNISITANGTIDGFKVQITQSNTSGDVLAAPTSLPTGISASFNSTIGVLTFTGSTSAPKWDTILRGVTFKASNAACYPTLREITFVAGKVLYNPLTEHFYETISSRGNWPTAKSNAALRSYYGKVGYLATMQSAAENNFIWKIMKAAAWMGASDDFAQINAAVGSTKYANQNASEKKWTWVTGPEAGTQFSNHRTKISGQYSNWAGGEPNNSGNNEHAGQFYSSNGGQWNDLNNNSTLSNYLVEYGGMPNDKTTNTPISSRSVAVSGSSSGIVGGGGVNVCASSNSTTLTITGLTGTVVRWEYSYDNFFTAGVTISNTTVTYTATNITQTTYYRAVVNATAPNTCNGLATSSAAITVNPTLPGNITALNSSICTGGQAELVLSGYQGSIVKWQTSTNNTTWTDITNTSNTLKRTVTTAGTVYFRAVVQTTGCGAAQNSNSKSITVISGTPPTGGSLNSLLLCSPATPSGTLTLTGYTGTIQKWQKSINQGVVWTDITNTTATYSLTNITSEVQYRVVLVNGSCGLAYSSVGKASLSSGLTALILSKTNVTCNGLGNGTIVGSVTGGISPYSYSWSNSSTNDTITGLSPVKFTVTVTDNNTCTSTIADSIVEPELSTSSVSDTACNSYTWVQSTRTYTSSGAYVDTITNAAGCDSIVTLNLIINSSSNSSSNNTACNSYTWSQNNVTYTSSGAYIDTVTNAAGCDSIITLNLTVNKSSNSSSNDTVCDNYTWSQNNVTYTSSGAYIDTVTNAAGCDSIITLNLTVNKSSNSSSNDTVCDSYTWSQNNVTYTSSGSYIDTITNAVGCDSIITLNLIVNSSNNSSISNTACDSYTWAQNKVTYISSGTYIDTTTNAAGCDSIVTLTLTIRNSSNSSSNNTVCDSYTWAQNNVTYTSSGAYTDTVTNAAGCDSIITLNLTVNSSSNSSISNTACDSYTWAQNNITYTSSGIYIDTTTNAVGCDSIVTLTLTIRNSSNSSIIETACASYAWAQNNVTYTVSGAYIDTVTNAVGCDSIITLNLTINNSSSSISAIACDSYTWDQNNITYATTGAYADTLPNAVGCDSVITLNLSIINLDLTISESNDSLVSNDLTAKSYQWIICGNSIEIIDGADSASYAPIFSGDYAVIVSDSICSDTSECKEFNFTSISESIVNSALNIYPNPTTGLVYVEIKNNFNTNESIKIYNPIGQLIKELNVDSNKVSFSLSEFENGTYFIKYGTTMNKFILNK